VAICDALLVELARRHGLPPFEVSAEATAALLAYDWPGNVRELQNALERAVVLASDGLIRREDLPPRLTERRARPAPESPLQLPEPAPRAVQPAFVELPPAAPASTRWKPEKVSDVEKRMIVEALERTAGNVSEVCRRLGIPRTSMYRKLKRYGIDVDEA